MIKDRWEEVQNKIKEACKKSDRDADGVHLIAVTKTKPVSMLQEAYDAGARDFGENKVQEILEKQDKLPQDIRWHMIGHLQRNKVKYIIDKVCMIHSVDSYRLAEEISKEAVKHDLIMPILLEVNIANEESKYGFSPKECEEMAVQISQLPNLQIEGLMTVAPFAENAENNRQYFKIMKELSVDIMTKSIDNVRMDILSMGMTGDYEIAIEEGATYVRVGTGIFGERNYQVNIE